MEKHWRKTSLTWGKRIILIILILVGLMYAVLSFAQRSKEPMRLGLQDYLKQVTGQNAEITDLAKLKLVPDLELMMTSVLIRDKDKPEKILAKAGQVYISLPFWRVLTASGEYLGFEIKNIETASGFFLPKKLNVDFMGISDSLPHKVSPYFLIEGRYNADDLLITGEMIRRNKKEKALYSFDKEFPITFKLGVLEGTGTFKRGFSDIGLNDVHLVHGSHEALFTVQNIERKPLKASLDGAIDGARFHGTLETSGEKHVLSLTPSTDDNADLKKITAFVTMLKTDIGMDKEPGSFDIVITQPLPEASSNHTENK